METGTVKFFDNRDNKRFGFLSLDNGEEIFFHYNDGAAVKRGLGRVVFDERSGLSRDPRKGDRIAFERDRGRRGVKACPWTFADDYQRVNAESAKREPVFIRHSGSMEYEFANEDGIETKYQLVFADHNSPRAWNVHAPAVHRWTNKMVDGSYNAHWRMDSDDVLDQVVALSLHKEMKAAARHYYALYKDAVDRRDRILVPILHEVLGDTSVEMNKDYEHSCITIYECDTGTYGKDHHRDPKELAEYQTACRELYGVNPIVRHYWEPKVPKQMRRWYPGGHSGGGFLGWGENLDEVIADDNETLARLGKTHEEVGTKINDILEEASKLWSVDNSKQWLDIGEYEVRLQYWMGYQTCPFEGCEYGDKKCPHASCDFQIKNKKTGEIVEGPGMIGHLISAHKFFEGKKSPYRVDPEQLVKVLYGS